MLITTSLAEYSNDGGGEMYVQGHQLVIPLLKAAD
jgi:hypothetical protein